MKNKYFTDIVEIFHLERVDEQGRPNSELTDSLEPYKSFIFKKLWKLWIDYKYHLLSNCRI